MKIFLPTTAFPRFHGDNVAEFIIDNVENINADFYVLAPRDLMSKRFERIRNNIFVKRFYYFWPRKYQRLAYGGGIAINIEKSRLAKLQIPFLAFGFIKNIFLSINKYDLIHAQMVFSAYLAFIVKKFTFSKIPLMMSFFGKDLNNFQKYIWLYRGILTGCDLFLALGQHMKNELIELGCNPGKIVIFHLGIDCNRFKFKKQISSKNGLKFLIVARFVEKKGIPYAIKAFSEVVKKYSKSNLTIVGDGPEYKHLLDLVSELKINDNVTFVNNMKADNPREAAISEYYKADVFLLSSISMKNDYGGTPIVLMEAQAVGLPCVVFDDSGNSEIIIDNKTGYIVKQKDISDFSKKMIYLIENPDIRLKFAKAGREHIINEFNREKQTKKLEAIYHQLTKHLK